MNEHSTTDGDSKNSGNERPTCDICDELARDRITVENEETGEKKDANLCGKHLDKLERYNRGQDVDWELPTGDEQSQQTE